MAEFKILTFESFRDHWSTATQIKRVYVSYVKDFFFANFEEIVLFSAIKCKNWTSDDKIWPIS